MYSTIGTTVASGMVLATNNCYVTVLRNCDAVTHRLRGCESEKHGEYESEGAGTVRAIPS